MESMSPVLSLSDLQTQFSTERGQVKAVDGVSLDSREGETVGLVGVGVGAFVGGVAAAADAGFLLGTVAFGLGLLG